MKSGLVFFLGLVLAWANIATDVTVYELAGVHSTAPDNPKPQREQLHGWSIEATFQNVHSAKVAEMITIADDPASIQEGVKVRCFKPGFGFSVMRERKRHDYLICFECHNMSVYIDGKLMRREVTFTNEAYAKMTTLRQGLLEELNTERKTERN